MNIELTLKLYYDKYFKNDMAGIIRIRTFLTCISFIYSKNVCVFWPLLWSEISRAAAEMRLSVLIYKSRQSYNLIRIVVH